MDTTAAAAAAAIAWEPPDEAATANAAAFSKSVILFDNIEIGADLGLFETEPILSEYFNDRLLENWIWFLLICGDVHVETGNVIFEVDEEPLIEFDFFNFGGVVNVKPDWEINLDKFGVDDDTNEFDFEIAVGSKCETLLNDDCEDESVNFKQTIIRNNVG